MTISNDRALSAYTSLHAYTRDAVTTAIEELRATAKNPATEEGVRDLLTQRADELGHSLAVLTSYVEAQ